MSEQHTAEKAHMEMCGSATLADGRVVPGCHIDTDPAVESAQVAAVEALAARWADVLAECKQVDPRWILDRSVTTLETALTELRTALRTPPGQRHGEDACF